MSSELLQAEVPGLALAPSLVDFIRTSYGAGVSGSWITIFTCGIAVTQAFNYFRDYPDDSAWIKATVWVTTLLNILHAIFVCNTVYYYQVTTALDTNIIDKLRIPWSVTALSATHVVIATIVLGYFTSTCFRLLTEKKMIRTIATIGLVVPVATHIGLGIAATIKTSQQTSVLGVTTLRRTVLIPMFSTQLVADFAMAVALCLALPKPTYLTTRSITHTIIVYTISRGILTSAAAFVELMVLLLDSNIIVFMSVTFIVPGLYTNSFLSALNARKGIRMRLTPGHAASSPVSVPLAFCRSQNESGTTQETATRSDAVTSGVLVNVYTTKNNDDKV